MIVLLEPSQKDAQVLTDIPIHVILPILSTNNKGHEPATAKPNVYVAI